MMEIQLLNGNWELKESGNTEILSAQVPGSVYGSYLAQGRMDDPFWKDNESNALEMMKKDYVYSRYFQVDEQILNCSRIEIVFEGIDTIAEIYLNGVKLGDVCNMHRTWRYDVKALLRSDENDLKVLIHSPSNTSEKNTENAEQMDRKKP